MVAEMPHNDVDHPVCAKCYDERRWDADVHDADNAKVKPKPPKTVTCHLCRHSLPETFTVRVHDHDLCVPCALMAYRVGDRLYRGNGYESPTIDYNKSIMMLAPDIEKAQYDDGELAGGVIPVYGVELEVFRGYQTVYTAAPPDERHSTWPQDLSYKNIERDGLHYYGISSVIAMNSAVREHHNEVARRLKAIVGPDYHEESLGGVSLTSSEGCCGDWREFKSVPCSLAFHRDVYAWDKLMGVFEKCGCQAFPSACGVHIHVNKAAVSGLGSIVFDMLVNRNRRRVESIAGRAERSNHAYKMEAGDDIEKILSASDTCYTDKFHSLNWRGHNATIECRIFGSTLSPSVMLSYIEFMDACVTFGNSCTLTPDLFSERAIFDMFLKHVKMKAKTRYPSLWKRLYRMGSRWAKTKGAMKKCA